MRNGGKYENQQEKTVKLRYRIEYDSGRHAVNQSARIGSRQR